MATCPRCEGFGVLDCDACNGFPVGRARSATAPGSGWSVPLPGYMRGERCPDSKHISTSHVERQNLNIRMGIRRFTRLTNAFSKKIDMHIYALSLYFVFYNFVRTHKAHKLSPAMTAGVSDKLWSMEDIVALIDARAPQPGQRGPYKKNRIAAN